MIHMYVWIIYRDDSHCSQLNKFIIIIYLTVGVRKMRINVLHMIVAGPISQYSDVIMSSMASQITGVSVVYSAVCLGADQKKNIKAPLHWSLWGELMFPFVDVIMPWYVRPKRYGWNLTQKDLFLSQKCLAWTGLFCYFFDTLRLLSNMKIESYCLSLCILDCEFPDDGSTLIHNTGNELLLPDSTSIWC